MNECIFAIGDNLKKEADFINKSGCAAGLAYVAAGRYDGYFSKNSIYGILQQDYF